MADLRERLAAAIRRQRWPFASDPPLMISTLSEYAYTAEADATLRLFAEWLRSDESQDEVQLSLASEWHQDQCGCDFWPGRCLTYIAPPGVPTCDLGPSTWTPGATLAALADSLEGQK